MNHDRNVVYHLYHVIDNCNIYTENGLFQVDKVIKFLSRAAKSKIMHCIHDSAIFHQERLKLGM